MKVSLRSGLAVALFISAQVLAGPALADTVTMVGTISKITLAPDGKSAEAVLVHSKTGADVTVRITDDETLDKFKDKRIVEGDEIRAKYESGEGKNQSKSFRKTAGC